MMTLQCGLQKRVTLLQYLKLFAFHLVVCFSPQFVLNALVQNNIDILIFPLGLKTVSVPVSSFSFIVLSLY